LFELADQDCDFCFDKQDEKIVCGGWNRVYLYPNGSIKASLSHCSKRLLEICKELEIEII